MTFVPVGYYCENKMAKIRCPHNRFLHIKYADYGRVDNAQCQDPMFEMDSSEMNPEVPCRSNVRNIIKAKYAFSNSNLKTRQV